MQATPTTWRMLLDSGWKGRPGLKALCGGEALPLELADQLVACGLELWNMYGPTETTIWSTVAPIRTQGEPLTIGRPIANTTLYIVDARGEPVPIGVPGELCIGGDGLARGYRGRPDLTEERFVPDRFDTRPGARLYRTGDLARYRRDGTVEFLGRIDHQVKVRGFRVELGEIETVLSRHPGVTRAVAVARNDDAAGAQLVAYFVPSGVPVSSGGLRRFVGQSLPDYMVPSAVVALDSFPLTPNGKIDRKALPAPQRERSDEQPYVAARTPLESRLVEIWERVLELEPIGVTDRFFDLGVTSIVAATLFARIEHELGGRLPLGAIFQAPTIESLARLIEDGGDGHRWTSLVPIQPHGTRPPLYCVHGGAGTILHLEPLARGLGEDQPFYGLQARGLYGGAPPLTTIEEMTAHYLSELRTVQPQGPYQLAGYCFGTIVAFDMAQTLVRDGEEVSLLAMFNGPSPAWIHKWGWYGNQPSRRVPRPPRPSRRTLLSQGLKQPWRVPGSLLRRAQQRRRRAVVAEVRLRLALGGQIPEHMREQYFLRISAKAERAYEPVPYPGRILMFYGEGLYEDPEMGWGGLAEGGIEVFAIPGEHDHNRQLMNEPYVDVVRDHLREHLA
jgi:thioesterase domain-containing protein/acyl carrier protein